MILTLLAYLADVAILGTYAALASGRYTARPFHYANALGGAPLVLIEVTTGAWPVLPLTLTFTVLGWWGVLKGDHS